MLVTSAPKVLSCVIASESRSETLLWLLIVRLHLASMLLACKASSRLGAWTNSVIRKFETTAKLFRDPVGVLDSDLSRLAE